MVRILDDCVRCNFLLNMFALIMFDVAQDVCAKTIKSLFEQLNLYLQQTTNEEAP